MARIYLPLLMVASVFFGPMYGYRTVNPVSDTTQITSVRGQVFLGEMIACLGEVRLPVEGHMHLPAYDECVSTEKINGSGLVANAVTGAALLAIAASLAGIAGILPLVGRLTSILTVLAGLGGLGAMGLFTLTVLGSPDQVIVLRWGVYLTSVLAFLVLVSGLSGMRGR